MTRGRRWMGVPLLAVLATLAWPDDTMRCGTHLVVQGMTREQVRELCGPPTSVESNGAVWVYDREPNQFLEVVTFVDDEVEYINERPREGQ